jgi:3-deoxy-7-phosphoheptulonate synthase
MIVAMHEVASEEQVRQVQEHLADLGFDVHRSEGRSVRLNAIGESESCDVRSIQRLPGVGEVHAISSHYKLAARMFRPEGTVVRLPNGFEIGSNQLFVMAGPCSVESREQIFSVAEAVARSGAKCLRGGAFKPRTSPYSFQGMGHEALKLLRQAADRFGLLVVSEVMQISQIQLMLPYVDILQVGSRNMQNFDLLRELGKIRKPVLLKRGIAATIEELLLAAEYVMVGGNYDVILCERGIRTFETSTRNTMDICAIPTVKKLSHLPIIADPSHGTGSRDKVTPMALAAIAAGADGLLLEVHNCPERALSDGPQSLYPEQFEVLMRNLQEVATAVRRELD